MTTRDSLAVPDVGEPAPVTMRVRILVVLLVGATYLLAGHLFGALAGRAASAQGRVAWRLAAWALSAIVFGAHIIFGSVRARLSASGAALDAAVAVALGAFGLAVAAFMHGVASHHRFQVWALVIWPVVTAVPAFLVALVMAVLVDRVSDRR